EETPIGVAAPRSEVDFVDGNGRPPMICAGAVRHVGVVAPAKGVDASDDRCRLWPEFGGKAAGIAFERQQAAVRCDDLELVDDTFCESRNEDLPQAGTHAFSHDVSAPVPGIEIADDGDAACVRRPDGEDDAIDAFVTDEVRAQLVVKAEMGAFG